MKNAIVAAVLLSTAALSAPVFAQGSADTTNNGALTRAEVHNQLASAQAAGLSPQSFDRRDAAYLYGASQRAALANATR